MDLIVQPDNTGPVVCWRCDSADTVVRIDDEYYTYLCAQCTRWLAIELVRALQPVTPHEQGG
jgi:hypothetical protein